MISNLSKEGACSQDGKFVEALVAWAGMILALSRAGCMVMGNQDISPASPDAKAHRVAG